MLKILYGLFLIILFAVPYQSVSAHVLKTDGTIGAVVHIDPEDDPIVGQETTVYFDIKDKTGQFKAESCECVFSVKKSGVEIYAQPLVNNMAVFVFPEKNVYTLLLTGKPKVDGQFQPFVFDYDVRLERMADENIPTASNTLITYLPHILVIIFTISICAFVIYDNKRKKL